ncbi:Uma2 family endonuclease [Sphingomonas sp. SUN039]|uniref:Uma2 family endonuclease n=1 Tax=Sphingomonas sp. SUN039 TaxID=2937787 RepID=UPI002164AD7A|nr:Uma2 family endonuclease [Sphingomonas sp. SUN039]UVO52596.1 Uma2 family endonuclease [Sphingomonas sp. SUN039]
MTALERLDPAKADKLGVADFERLYSVGAFADLGRIELLDGEVVKLSAQARPHLRLKTAIFLSLRDAVIEHFPALTVFPEGTVVLSEYDAPDPDVLVTDDAEGSGFVRGASVPLVVEVSDTTLRADLGRKAILYASAGIAEYWVADVNGRVHQMWSPSSEGYRERRTIVFGEPINSVELIGVSVVVTA